MQQASVRFVDKVVLVTGGASGVGEQTALRFAAEGASVVVADVDRAAGEALLERLGERASFVALDVADEADWQAAMAHVQGRYGQLDVLVNNAGILRAGSIEETSLETWRQLMRVNADGVFLGCKHAVEAMRECGGAIVNMSSFAALAGMPEHMAYSASKGAVAALTRSVASYCRHRRYRIRCNSVHPDGVLTPMVRSSYPAGIDPATLTIDADPMHRMCLPADVAAAILFLAADEARAVNGIELRVDSGQFVMGI
jgi:3(or 17)beta-hydroxysteroid dehydrogenase